MVRVESEKAPLLFAVAQVAELELADVCGVLGVGSWVVQVDALKRAALLEDHLGRGRRMVPAIERPAHMDTFLTIPQTSI